MKFPSRIVAFFCLLFAGGYNNAYATHFRAGEVLYSIIGNYQIQATIITYTKWSYPSNLADRDTETISWGDGSTSQLPRINGPINGDGVPGGVFVAPDIKKNIYMGTHQYSGQPPNGFFLISFFDNNRMAGINNINDGNSVEVPFYVEDTLKFPTNLANIGFYSSPILYHPPIDYANVNDTFYHNPLAVDTSGDSLDFQFKVCLQANNFVVPDYVYPGEFCRSLSYNPGNPKPNDTMTIDRHTGQIVWAVPCVTGIFNIAILVHTYREGVNIGTLERDMQIIVLDIPDNPPTLSNVPDTCVRAGDTLITPVTSHSQPLQGFAIYDSIYADGGPFHVPVSPATFSSVTGNPASGTFTWYTVCDHIQEQPYLVLFDASDNYNIGGTPAPLVDLEPWQIYVIPPPVQDLTATANHNIITLKWQDPYECSSFGNFRGFSVWRKTGCDLFTPDYCETGLAGRGYTKLTTDNIQTYTYTDNTAVVGEQYTYRVLAEFYKLPPSGSVYLQYDNQESVPSNGACVFVPIQVPVITNVSVLKTDPTNGQMFVRWTKPLAGGTNLDTLVNPPPYQFKVFRSQGFTFPNNTTTTVYTSAIAQSYSAIVDTFFTDSLIGTSSTPWSYEVLFFSNNDTVGPSNPASSVFLSTRPTNKALYLSWQENVPWLEDSFAVFKLNKLTSSYDSIAITYQQNYLDSNLINDSTYCYYIKTYGHYTVTTLPSPLINLSQRICGSPVDTIPPCPPVLNVTNNCGLYQGQSWGDTLTSLFTNYLQWSEPNDSCTLNVIHYRIYFGSDSAHLSYIDSLTSPADTTFNHVQTDNLAGCYAVTAIDINGNQSHYSNIVCVDNCPYYVLPNTFTPNGDGHNDLFTPFPYPRFITKIDMKIFNRWGDLVFETNNPDINWDGNDQKTGKPCAEGVYLYAGYYYVQQPTGLARLPLSGMKKGGGFIQLIRK